jgi:hypothetical protein
MLNKQVGYYYQFSSFAFMPNTAVAISLIN